ncbi:PREDICTED: WD repeat-containing protein 74-like [Priapulus caudatus]|uniref:WD repeat-containing protein 74-like n=1 Tax=Priapulus caudatus TaxID=37621 RepID=A0ABM1ECV3_PRICU|nr:PREDICTED: WD repeat-containing protein 74-like [Priapulus caudatus]
MAPSMSYNVFVGAATGLLKGVNFTQQKVDNLNTVQNLGNAKEQEIEVMCWGDSEQSQICFGSKNRMVKCWDSEHRSFTNILEAKGGTGAMRGLAKLDNNIITCVESGQVTVWDTALEEVEKVKFEVGGDVCKMRHNAHQSNQIATGGKENELKIWDLTNSSVPLFTAKNVPHDFLNLRVPVWITDMQFVPDSEKIITCTGYHQVRMYDPSTPQRRPVINVEFDEYPIVSMSLTANGSSVVVGNARGNMALVDLRHTGRVVQQYKGAIAGSLRCVHCHPTEPLVASCGLDRFLRIHDVNTKKLLHKVYLKSKLNCLLFSSAADRDTVDELEPSAIGEAKPVTQAEVSNEVDDDDLWDTMPVITERPQGIDGTVGPTTAETKCAAAAKGGIKKRVHQRSDDSSESSSGEEQEELVASKAKTKPRRSAEKKKNKKKLIKTKPKTLKAQKVA